MIRTVNLIDHLPSYIQKYREIQGIMNAENPEVQLVEDASETIKNNMFVLHTDEAGIQRYEKMFGLTPLKNDNLDDRQRKVLSHYTNSVIYTLQGLINRLNAICGVDNYTIELIPNEYKINIKLRFSIKSSLPAISSMLFDMIPANMICNCAVERNTHVVLSEYPNYLLSQFTHVELQDELIDSMVSTKCEDIANHKMESLKTVCCEHITNYGARKV